MTTVRIAHVRPRLGQPADSGVAIGPVLVVLADDAGHRALPLWLTGLAGYALWRAFGQPSREPSGVPGDIPPGQTATGGLIAVDLAGRLLRAAAIPVTSVDVDELGPDVLAARITVPSPAGPQQVTVRVGIGLALAAVMGAPVRVAGALMDRLAVRVTGDDVLEPFLHQGPPRPVGPLPEPRNLAFADGLVGWIIGGSFQAGPTMAHWQDYSAAAADGASTLRSAVPHPYGDAFLGQAFAAGNYRGATVRLRAQVRAENVAGQAELWLQVVTRDRSLDMHGRAFAGSQDWTRHEVTAQVPAEAELIRFGLTLTGPGQVGLRNAELTRTGR